MKIVVVGGLGLIGSNLVAKLGDHGHDAVAASRRTGVDTLTREGLAEALDGADVVVDVTNSPSFEDDAVVEFFRTSTGNLVAAEQVAGVGHHVAVSVVGSDRLPDSGYMRAKVVQEELIEGASIPYTIVRSTQFYQFVQTIAYVATEGDTVRLPSARIQPIAADDVAPRRGQNRHRHTRNGIVEIASPAYRFDECIGAGPARARRPANVVVDPDARYFGAALDDAGLLPGETAPLGETRFEDGSTSPRSPARRSARDHCLAPERVDAPIYGGPTTRTPRSPRCGPSSGSSSPTTSLPTARRWCIAATPLGFATSASPRPTSRASTGRSGGLAVPVQQGRPGQAPALALGLRRAAKSRGHRPDR